MNFLVDYSVELVVLGASVWAVWTFFCPKAKVDEADAYEDNDSPSRDELESTLTAYTQNLNYAEEEEFKTDFENQIEPTFEAACELVQRFKLKVGSRENQLNLYGLYKQAKFCDCTDKEPPRVYLEAKLKWSAWTRYKGLNAPTAMHKYVWYVSEIARMEREGIADLMQEAQKGVDYSNEAMAVCNPTYFEMPEENVNLDKVFEWASENKQTELATAIDSDKGVLSKRDENGQTVLHWAADKGHVELVTMLLQRNAEVDARDNMQETALFAAVASGREEVTKLLLKNGAAGDTKNVDGETVFDIAEGEAMQTLLRADG